MAGPRDRVARSLLTRGLPSGKVHAMGIRRCVQIPDPGMVEVVGRGIMSIGTMGVVVEGPRLGQAAGKAWPNNQGAPPPGKQGWGGRSQVAHIGAK